MMDDFFEKKILETINDDSTEPNVMFNRTADNVSYHGMNGSIEIAEKYNKMPSAFTDVESWPDRTNILCWYCSLEFDNMPVFIPKAIEPVVRHNNNKKLSITPEGVFCGFGCAHEFIQTRKLSIIDRIEKLNRLKYLYKLLYDKGLPSYHLYPAPYCMVQYGGTMRAVDYKSSIAAFRCNFEH